MFLLKGLAIIIAGDDLAANALDPVDDRTTCICARSEQVCECVLSATFLLEDGEGVVVQSLGLSGRQMAEAARCPAGDETRAEWTGEANDTERRDVLVPKPNQPARHRPPSGVGGSR